MTLSGASERTDPDEWGFDPADHRPRWRRTRSGERGAFAPRSGGREPQFFNWLGRSFTPGALELRTSEAAHELEVFVFPAQSRVDPDVGDVEQLFVGDPIQVLA